VRIPEGWALITPDTASETSPVARLLLKLAETPADVRTQRGGREFLVPEALADRYRKSLNRPRRAKKESTDG
jgi:hypothetical protein